MLTPGLVVRAIGIVYLFGLCGCCSCCFVVVVFNAVCFAFWFLVCVVVNAVFVCLFLLMFFSLVGFLAEDLYMLTSVLDLY